MPTPLPSSGKELTDALGGVENIEIDTDQLRQFADLYESKAGDVQAVSDHIRKARTDAAPVAASYKGENDPPAAFDTSVNASGDAGTKHATPVHDAAQTLMSFASALRSVADNVDRVQQEGSRKLGDIDAGSAGLPPSQGTYI